jgi:hypothetical protein
MLSSRHAARSTRFANFFPMKSERTKKIAAALWCAGALGVAGVGVFNTIRHANRHHIGKCAEFVSSDCLLLGSVGIDGASQEILAALAGLKGRGPVLFFAKETADTLITFMILSSLCQPREVWKMQELDATVIRKVETARPAAMIFLGTEPPAQWPAAKKIGTLRIVRFDT